MANAISSVKRRPSPVTITQMRVDPGDMSLSHNYAVGEICFNAEGYTSISVGNLVMDASLSFTADGMSFPFVQILGTNDMANYASLGSGANTTCSTQGYKYCYVKIGFGADPNGVTRYAILNNIAIK